MGRTGTIPTLKDAVENKLHAAACSGLIQLAPAQKAIAADWVTAFDTVGLHVAGGKVCLRDKPTSCVNLVAKHEQLDVLGCRQATE